jgi:tetratricopeptide (TPR) repeat protein
MTVGLAASVILAGALGVAGWRVMERDRMARITASSARVGAALQEATGLVYQARTAQVGDLVSWTRAAAAAEKARELLEPGLDPALRREVEALSLAVTHEKEEAESAAKAAESNQVLMEKLVDIRSAKADDPDGTISDRDYAEAFRAAGIDVEALSPEKAGDLIKSRPAPVAAAMAAALDDWADVRHVLRRDRPGALRIRQRADAADPDPWRVNLRRAFGLADRAVYVKAIRELAASVNSADAPAVNLAFLGSALAWAKETKAAEEIYRVGCRRFPNDLWLNFELARLLEQQSRADEAARYYSIARALRPETAHSLAHLLSFKGESVEAVAVFRDLVRLRPGNPYHWRCYGRLLLDRGERAEAKEAFAEAVAILQPMVRLKPDDFSTRCVLGLALEGQGNLHEALAEFQAAARLRPRDDSPHAFIGQILLDQEKPTEAVEELRKAIVLKADSASSYSLLGLALGKLGKHEEAAAAHREAIRLRPDLAYGYTNLGIELEECGRIEDAIAEVRKAIRIEPDNVKAYRNLGTLLHRQGKLDLAIAEFHKAIELQPNFADAHNDLGWALKAQGKLDQAIAEYRKAIDLEPDSARARINLGRALMDQGQLVEAVAEFENVIRQDARDADAHNNLGICLYQLGKPVEAIREFHAAIRLRPDHAIAHNSLGMALIRQGQVSQAIAEFQLAIRLKPDYVEPRLNLGAILCDQKHDYTGAEAHFREVIRLKPDNAYGHLYLGNALRNQAKLVDAIAAYNEAIRLKPREAKFHQYLGNALRDQEKVSEAIGEFQKAIELDPNDAAARVSLGAILCDVKHDYAGAEAQFGEAIRLQGNDPNAHYCLGLSLRHQGKLDQAIAALEEAIRLQPGNPGAYEILGDILLGQGKPPEAIAKYRQAIRLNPNNAEARNSLAWALVFAPGRPPKDYEEGLAQALKAVESDKQTANSYGTLALAHYRAGHWAESLAASEQAIKLRGGPIGYDGFFQSMARWHTGDKDEAGKWFDKAVDWTRRNAAENLVLRGFWSEAAELLRRPGPGTPDGVAAAKPR